MNKGSTYFLRAAVFILGAVVLAVCIIVLPVGLRGGGSVNYRSIIIGMYIAAVPFFYALYETWRLLGNIDKNKAFSELSVASLKHIKYSAVSIGALYLVGMPFVFMAAAKDDAPGVAAIGLVIIFASGVVATFAAILQRLLEDAIRIKSENELTV